MTIDELKRLPFVSDALAAIHPHNSTCGVCGLPWCECKPECIDINEHTGVFYVCDYCFRHRFYEFQNIFPASSPKYQQGHDHLQMNPC